MMRRTHFCSVGAFAFAGHLLIKFIILFVSLVAEVAVESLCAVTTLCMRCVVQERLRDWILFWIFANKHGGKVL